MERFWWPRATTGSADKSVPIGIVPIGTISPFWSLFGLYFAKLVPILPKWNFEGTIYCVMPYCQLMPFDWSKSEIWTLGKNLYRYFFQSQKWSLFDSFMVPKWSLFWNKVSALYWRQSNKIDVFVHVEAGSDRGVADTKRIVQICC